MLFVVIAEEGEYSDRNDWVAGVFDNRAEAERLVIEKSAEVRQMKTDRDAYWAKYRAWNTKHLGQSWDHGENTTRDAEIGPAPPREAFDQLYLVEVPLNVWGKYKFA